MYKDEQNIEIEACEICPVEKTKKILMVVTSADEFKNGHKTGIWFEEFAIPYLEFLKQNYFITVASPNGGCAPIDPKSENLSEDIKWEKAKIALNDTVPINTVDFASFDALVLPGGHGPIIDLYKNEDLAKIIENFNERHKLIAAICHGPAGLILAKDDNGFSILKDKNVTSFTNKEEHIVKMDEFMPFLLETKLKELGANFIEEKPWSEHVEICGNIITGQNQKSATLIAESIISKL